MDQNNRERHCPNTETQGKKKTRRSKKKTNTKHLTIWYTNINGIASKLGSLQNIMSTDNPHTVILTETKSNKCPKIPGWTWINEIKPNNAGGVAIAVRDDIAKNTEDLDVERDKEMEVAWIGIKTKQGKIYVGGYYGKQEGEKKEKVENEYSQLNTQILRLKKEGNIILVGDFNAKLEIKTNNIKQQESRNGKILKRSLKTTGLKTINTTHETAGWTRVNRNNTTEKSVIDYVITDQKMNENLEELKIDEEGNHRPRGKNESDHNTIIAKFKIQADKTTTTIPRWSINKNTNWEKYNEIIEKTRNIKNYEEMTKTMTTALSTVAKKRKIKTDKNKVGTATKEQRNNMKEKKKYFNKQCQTNGPNKKQAYDKYIEARKKLQNMLSMDQRTNILETANRLIKEGGVKSPYFWRLRNKITSPKQIEYDLITEDDQKIQNPEKAKSEIAKYYKELYKPRGEVSGYELWTNKITQKYNEIKEEMDNLPDTPIITRKEMNEAIKKMKDNKASGPDDIPNEAINKMNKTNREQLRTILNTIIKNGMIPETWTNSYITRIYKGKGEKGKCSSERGITLSSNIGKLFERIINNRIEKSINISDEQAGGRKKRATTDHINVLKSIARMNKKRKKPTYIVFLDVTKAYDKAWLKAIMYVLHKQGIKDKRWDIINKLNANLTAEIRTKYGLTEPIHIEDSIRQGGVLSVIQYALLMDEIAKENKTEEIGLQVQNSTERINTLLWMDDVALITDNLDDIKKLIAKTYDTANRYRINFGKDKSKILQIGKDPLNPQPREKLYMGDMELEYTNKYKYLGITINEKLNMIDHISTIKGKTEAAYQTIINLLHDATFMNIQMKVAWKLIETCITPIITYASETWIPNKSEMKILQKTLDDVLKRILMTPLSTPREALYIETNLLDVERIIDKKKLNMYYRIMKNQTNLTKYLTQTNEKTTWMTNIELTATKYGIELQELTAMTTKKSKVHIRKKIQTKFRELLFNNKEGKSKIKYLTEGYLRNEKTTYTDLLDRQQTSIIFKARCRMLDIKNNYKNKYTNNTCRLCKQQDETQEHIFERCPETRKYNLDIRKHIIFSRSTSILKDCADKIKNIQKMLENNTATTQ